MLMETDIILDEEAFATAAADMRALEQRTNRLKQTLTEMYEMLKGAMDTEAGHEVELQAKSVLLEPVKNMALVVKEIASTLEEVSGTGYYKDVFTKYEELNNMLKS